MYTVYKITQASSLGLQLEVPLLCLFVVYIGVYCVLGNSVFSAILNVMKQKQNKQLNSVFNSDGIRTWSIICPLCCYVLFVDANCV